MVYRVDKTYSEIDGKKFYFTGRPCKRGHITNRYVKNSMCVGCAKSRDYKAEHQMSRGNHPLNIMLYSAKARAKKTGREFTITAADLTLPAHCPCCTAKIDYNYVPESGKRNPFSPSIDRIDPMVGYISGNVEIICHSCNRLKNSGTILDFERILNYMRSRLEKPQTEITHLKLVSGENK
jgi:hypothetical protein